MIRAVELTKVFPVGAGEVLAVDRLSFRVPSGEVYGLLGPNGAGKTTTLRMLLGLLEPTQGYVEVDGVRTSGGAAGVKRRIGFISAGVSVYASLTPREMLLYFADLYDVPLAAATARLEQLSELLEIGEVLDRRCGTLSTGQAQRVNLARALIHDPPIMLMDEPTRGLDVLGSQVIFEYIAHVRGLGKAVVVSTHRLDQAQELCDRFGLLNRGRLTLEGTLAELRSATGCSSLTEMFLRLAGGSRTTASAARGAGEAAP